MHNNYNETREISGREGQVLKQSDLGPIVKDCISKIGTLPDDDRGKVVYELTLFHLDALDKRAYGLKEQLDEVNRARVEFTQALDDIGVKNSKR